MNLRRMYVQLDQSGVRVMGELNEVVIRLASSPKVFQGIDIVAMHIPEAYTLLLSRDWSSKLNGYLKLTSLTCF